MEVRCTRRLLRFMGQKRSELQQMDECTSKSFGGMFVGFILNSWSRFLQR